MSDIIEIIGKTVELKPLGNHFYTGKCPFCDGKDNHLLVRPALGRWGCLACKRQGEADEFERLAAAMNCEIESPVER